MYDFGVVFCGVIIVVISLFMSLETEVSSPIISFWRVSKLLCLFRMVEVFRKLFQTFVLAFPAMANLFLLFFIFIGLFSVIGVFLFAGIKYQSSYNSHANFRTFPYAVLTSWALATGDTWTGVLHDAMRQNIQYFSCVDYPTYTDVVNNGGDPNGCGLIIAPIYFVLIQIVVIFIFLNLFIAIVVSSIQDITKLSESVLSDDKLAKFQNIWKQFDPDVYIQNNFYFIRLMDLWNIFICGK